MVRSLAFGQELWREVHYGEYAAKCECCKTFRTHPEDIEPKAQYDNQVRQAVIDRMHAWRAEGLSLRAIAGRLDSMVIPPKRGARWHAKVIAQILGR